MFRNWRRTNHAIRWRRPGWSDSVVLEELPTERASSVAIFDAYVTSVLSLVKSRKRDRHPAQFQRNEAAPAGKTVATPDLRKNVLQVVVSPDDRERRMSHRRIVSIAAPMRQTNRFPHSPEQADQNTAPLRTRLWEAQRNSRFSGCRMTRANRRDMTKLKQACFTASSGRSLKSTTAAVARPDCTARRLIVLSLRPVHELPSKGNLASNSIKTLSASVV